MNKHLQRGKIEIIFDVYTDGNQDDNMQKPSEQELFRMQFTEIMSNLLNKKVLDCEYVVGECAKV